MTIATQNREPLLGEVAEGGVQLAEAGQVVQSVWDGLPRRFSGVELDAFVVMPNHVHGIAIITDIADRRTGGGETPPLPMGTKPTLGRVVAYFKYQSAKRINDLRSSPGTPVWQRNYYEHIIRDDHELDRAREYIADNPRRWADDQENPAAKR